jgi:hypothetical protein
MIQVVGPSIGTDTGQAQKGTHILVENAIIIRIRHRSEGVNDDYDISMEKDYLQGLVVLDMQIVWKQGSESLLRNRKNSIYCGDGLKGLNIGYAHFSLNDQTISRWRVNNRELLVTAGGINFL